eukprot:scaffold1220_cov259-Pinguiococcus_pyrenoidosus.AAC.16
MTASTPGQPSLSFVRRHAHPHAPLRPPSQEGSQHLLMHLVISNDERKRWLGREQERLGGNGLSLADAGFP